MARGDRGKDAALHNPVASTSKKLSVDFEKFFVLLRSHRFGFSEVRFRGMSLGLLVFLSIYEKFVLDF